MKRIEFGSLTIGQTARNHINDCLDNNWISGGPKVKLLEEQFAKLMGSNYAVMTSSGTSSLIAMTLALPEIAKRKVVRGKSNVICPALGFIANSTGIIGGGLLPNWVDIEPHTLNINEDLVESSINDDTVAIYCIGTMGRPCKMDKLRDLADKYDLVLFEDGCENYGSKYKGEFSHKYAIAGNSSLFQAHLIQAGEGSVIFTDNEQLRDLLLSIRSHGRKPNSAYFDHIRLGYNFKSTDLCASIGLEGVEQFNENIETRKKIWYELVDFTQQFKDKAWFSSEDEDMVVMPHGFSITVKPMKGYDIHNLVDLMENKYNIHTKRNFGLNCHHLALSEYRPKMSHRRFSKANYCGRNGIHIGCHRNISESDILRIKDCLYEFFK